MRAEYRGDSGVDSAFISEEGRDPSLDVLKGTLVIAMVVYHTMNFFTTADADAYAFIRFVSGSFIILAGYIVGRFEVGKLAEDRAGVSARLFQRGQKLFLLFTVLNMAITLTGVGNPEKTRAALSGEELLHIYVTGDLGHASFQILLPIAYLMMLSPLLLMFRAHAVALLTTTFAASSLQSFVFNADFVNAEFLLLGLIGLYGGVALNACPAPAALREPWRIGVALSLAIVAMKWLVLNLTTYALGTIAIMRLLFDAARAADKNAPAIKGLALLGRYSLFSYIAQIFVLQFAWRALGRPKWDIGLKAVLVVAGTSLGLYALAVFVSWIRKRNPWAEYAYNAVFK